MSNPRVIGSVKLSQSIVDAIRRGPQEEQMKPHEERVIAEEKELREKASKLSDFIFSNEAFANLEKEDQNLLILQHFVMTRYIEVLNMRIGRFGRL